MNRITAIICICLALMSVSCMQETGIEGTVARKSARKVMLYAYGQGELHPVSTAVPDEGGNFSFLFRPEKEGFYLVGDYEKALYPLYVSGGERLKIEIKRNGLVLQGGAGEANSLLYGWESMVAGLREHAYLQAFIPEGKSLPYGAFFEELEETAARRTVWLDGLQSCRDRKLADLLARKSETELCFYAISYLRTQGMNIPDSVSLPPFYDGMRLEALFQDEAVLDLPYAGQMLDAFVWYSCRENPAAGPEGHEYRLLKTPALRQEYLLTQAGRFRFYDDFQELYARIDRDLLTPGFEARLDRIREGLAWSAPGTQAPDFKGMKQDSTFLALSDFRGKVVVVDVWATWCAPCRRMMPHFVQLEKELAGEDIAFLSVCMGVSVERDLWQEIIAKDGLGGNLCFIDSWTGPFARDYRITGVPRYMVFDREGKVVSLKAPKPDKPQLKEMVLKALAGKNR